MVKLWRPSEVEWGNRWGVEDEINRLLYEEGFTMLAVLPADKWSRVPTFVFQNDVRWRPRWSLTLWQRCRWWFKRMRRADA